MSIVENIKTSIRTWLEITPAADMGAIVVHSPISFETHVLRSRVWRRGDPAELSEFFKAVATTPAAMSRFWAAAPEIPIRKIHLDIPSQIVDKLASIVSQDMEGVTIEDETLADLWANIAADNRFDDLINEAIAETLTTGDGAFKISIDPSLSDRPIIEFYGADRITPNRIRGRLQSITFHTLYTHKSKTYRLDEEYSAGKITASLVLMDKTKGDIEVSLNTIPQTDGLIPEVTFTSGRMLAVYMKFLDSALWKGRGASVLASKTESFDALDEVISEWWDDYRKGRVKQFMPENMFPRDPATGKIRRPNEFDDIFVMTGNNMQEGGGVAIKEFAPDMRSAQYAIGYAQALDMALMGIISPSTLGIDLKKTDNAEAQREKEKATLWTRAKIVAALTEAIPNLVQIAIAAADEMNGATPRAVEASVTFGEYASPSFDAALDSMSIAAQWNLLSIETIIDELYGDTKDDAWKAVEAGRIRELRGITTLDEPVLMESGKPDDIIEGDVIDAVPASVSLNGAQMQSLLKIVETVKTGTLSKAAAIAIIGSSLPLSPEQARNILQDVT